MYFFFFFLSTLISTLTNEFSVWRMAGRKAKTKIKKFLRGHFGLWVTYIFPTPSRDKNPPVWPQGDPHAKISSNARKPLSILESLPAEGYCRRSSRAGCNITRTETTVCEIEQNGGIYCSQCGPEVTKYLSLYIYIFHKIYDRHDLTGYLNALQQCILFF